MQTQTVATSGKLRAIRAGEITECPDCRTRARTYRCQTCGGNRRVIWRQIDKRLEPTHI
jgi:hypothetical protein